MIESVPHVVHLIDELPPDGAERLLADILRHRSERFRFSVVCLIDEGTLAGEIRAMGVPVTVLGRHGKLDPSLVFRLASWLRQQRADVVHTHLFTADSYGRVAARLAGVPAVFSTAHGIIVCEGTLRRVIHWALSWISTRVIACSDEVHRVLCEKDHLPASRVSVILNGIDVGRFAGASGAGVRTEFGIPDDTVLLGVLGRLHPAKGHHDLITALARLRDEGLAFACLVIGSGELKNELVQQAARTGLSDRIVFTGHRADVPRLLAALDVFAMPSRWEGLPMALLEAMAMSKPVVATRVGGIPDVVRDEANGLLVAPGDPPALAAALRRLLTEPALRDELGQQALATVRRHHDVTRTAREYEALYSAALGLAAVPGENP
jgi:glycosyltransferase involved in cell wall biosynthesis